MNNINNTNKSEAIVIPSKSDGSKCNTARIGVPGGTEQRSSTKLFFPINPDSTSNSATISESSSDPNSPSNLETNKYLLPPDKNYFTKHNNSPYSNSNSSPEKYFRPRYPDKSNTNHNQNYYQNHNQYYYQNQNHNSYPYYNSPKENTSNFVNSYPPVFTRNTNANNKRKYYNKSQISKSLSPSNYTDSENALLNNYNMYNTYDAVQRAKGAGIIPYCILDGQIYFLLQKTTNPHKKKDDGWNDFGGKKNNIESTADAAGREFSEETSCLFYLKEPNRCYAPLGTLREQSNVYCDKLFEQLKDNPTLTYDTNSINNLKQILPVAAKFFSDKINSQLNPLYISSKETYISYIVKVVYVAVTDIPRAEDIHIPYEDRYIRTCRWFSIAELMNLNETEFHKRLQITKIKNRIRNFYERGSIF